MVKDTRPSLPRTPKPGEPAEAPAPPRVVPKLLSVGTAIAVGIAVGAGMLASAGTEDLASLAGPPSAEAAEGATIGEAATASLDGVARGPGPHPSLAGVLDACEFTVGARALVSASVNGKKARLLLLRTGVDWLLVDALWGTHPRYAWRDGALTYDTRSTDAPAPPPDVPDVIVRDLFEGCRAGFPGARWTTRRPDEDGYSLRMTALGWSKAALPYAWATGVDLYVGVNVHSGELAEVVWRHGRPPTWGHARVAEVDWAVTDVPVFDRSAPDVEIRPPARYQHIE